MYILLSPAVVVTLLLPITPVAVVAFLVGTAVHYRMDRYGGGLELRP